MPPTPADPKPSKPPPPFPTEPWPAPTPVFSPLPDEARTAFEQGVLEVLGSMVRHLEALRLMVDVLTNDVTVGGKKARKKRRKKKKKRKA